MKPTLLSIVGLIMGGVFWITATGCDNMGLVTGTVSFSGKPCQQGPDFAVPPCTGPYANYKVEVYRKGDQSTVVATTVTGAKGEFTLPMEEGEYVIYAQRGEGPEAMREYPFVVTKKEQVTVEISVSTGIQ